MLVPDLQQQGPKTMRGVGKQAKGGTEVPSKEEMTEWGGWLRRGKGEQEHKAFGPGEVGGPAGGEEVWEEGGFVPVKMCWVLRARMCMWPKSNGRQRREGSALGIGMGGDPGEVGVCASHVLG